MLGKQIFEKFNACNLYNITTTGQTTLENSKQHFQIDLFNTNELIAMLKAVKPDIIIHCAAITNLTYCIDNPDKAHKLHVEVSAELASFNTVEKMIYISTDSVFDGAKGNYSEEDITNPLNIYALTKRDGELAIMDAVNNGYIIRTNIIGFKKPLNNSLFEWACQKFLNGDSIIGYSNVMFNPLYTGSLAKMLLDFIQSEASPGIYNFASKEAISKYMFLEKIAMALGISQELVKPAKLDNSLSNLQRPLNTSLKTEKVSKIGIDIPDIDSCINELIRDFKIAYNYV